MHTSLHKVFFFPVHNPKEKVGKILHIVHVHFLHKISLALLLPDSTALDFVSQRLWKDPPEGFFPHHIVPPSLSKKIQAGFQLILTTQPSAIEITSLLNLLPLPFFPSIPGSKIYDFEELFSAEKLEMSKKKFSAYKAKEFFIESHDVCVL